MRIFLKQAEISAAIALYIASKGLALASDTELDITFSITRNPTSVTAEFEVPDLAPVALSLDQVIKAEAAEKSLEVGQVNEPLVGELLPDDAPLNQLTPQTQEQQDALLDAHQSGEAGVAELPVVDTANLGVALGETTEQVVDPVTDLNLVMDPVEPVAEAPVEVPAETAVAQEPANDGVAPVADTKSLFG